MRQESVHLSCPNDLQRTMFFNDLNLYSQVQVELELEKLINFVKYIDGETSSLTLIQRYKLELYLDFKNSQMNASNYFFCLFKAKRTNKFNIKI